ncbi:MAG: hypothetical protein WAL52_18575 [Candidatus Sulfotelmatobacter sp.]
MPKIYSGWDRRDRSVADILLRDEPDEDDDEDEDNGADEDDDDEGNDDGYSE